MPTLDLLTAPLPIFSEQQEDGRIAGYSIEYAQSIFRLAGYEPEVTALPFARLYQQMQSEKPAVATGIGRTPEREDEFFWIAPMTANVIGIFAVVDKSKRTKAHDSLESLNSVGVLRGDYRADILRDKGVQNIAEFNSWEQAIKALIAGRIESLFFSELGFSVTCKTAKLDCSTIKKTYTHQVLFSYLAMPKTDQNREHAIKLANAAERFLKSRTFNQLTARWLPQLQLMGDSVSVSDGVIMLGEINQERSYANPIWVLTNLEPPFSEIDQRGRISGYAVELVNGILTEAGLRQQILAVPWQRILVESETKSDVLVFSLARTQEREDKFYWVSPITQNAYSVFAREQDEYSATINSLEQLPAASRVAVLAGDFREKIIVNAGLKAVTGPDWGTVLQQFVDGEAEYLFFSDGGVDILCKIIQSPCEGINRVFQYQLATTYLAVSKQGTSIQLVEKLKSAAENFKRSSEFQIIVDGWLSEYKQRDMPNMHEDNGIIKLWAKN